MTTTTTPDHTTGAELQTMREAAGLTREELAELVGVQARTVKHWEAGRAGVPADVAAEAARWVRCTVATAQGLHAQARAMAAAGAPVVLTRYKTAADMPAHERAQCPHSGAHGAAVGLAVALLAMSGTPARVVWFDPAHFATWRSAHQASDTPKARQLWALGALQAQALPHRGDQPAA